MVGIGAVDDRPKAAILIAQVDQPLAGNSAVEESDNPVLTVELSGNDKAGNEPLVQCTQSRSAAGRLREIWLT